MTSTSRITTIAATAVAAATLSAAPASAMHIVGHTANAVKQDVKDLGERAGGHVHAARETVEQTGERTRRQAQAIAHEHVRSTSRTVRSTRSAAEREVAQQAEKLKRRSRDTRATAQRRVAPVQRSARRTAGRASSTGRGAARRADVTATRVAGRAGSAAARLLAGLEARVWMLVRPVSAKLAEILEGGSVVASISGSGTYSAGWTRTGGCWKVRVETPLNLPTSRQRRRTGTTAEPMPGQRSSAYASGGSASASAGC